MQSRLVDRSQSVVIKVGGSMLRYGGDYERMAGLLRPLMEQGAWVVVSAAYGITDSLTRLSRERMSEGVSLLLKHHERLTGVPVPPKLRRELAATVQNGSAPEGVIMTWGERASAAALREHLSRLGTRVRISELPFSGPLPNGGVALVPGFYMRDARGGIRLLPRGGSDISAVLLAVRLGVPRVRLWKNGGGIHDAGEPTGIVEEIDGPTLMDRLGDAIHPLHPASLQLAIKQGIELILEDPTGEFLPTRIISGTVWQIGRENGVRAAVSASGNNRRG